MWSHEIGIEEAAVNNDLFARIINDDLARRSVEKAKKEIVSAYNLEAKVEKLKGQDRPIRVLSLGWGLQSTALAVMAARGEIDVDFIVHADTAYESSHTYAYAEKFTPWLVEQGCTVITVRDFKATTGNASHEWHGTFIPAFTLSEEGKGGQLRRQCTQKWKIAPIRRFSAMVLKALGREKTPGCIQQLLGISLDEFTRAKDSDVKYIEHVYPLLDMRMSRADCAGYLERNGIETPNPSACTFCPYHSNTAWQEQKREDGPDWAQSIKVDDLLRDQRPPYPLFVHAARVPLEDAVSIPEDDGYAQGSFFNLELENAQCDSGHCFM